jgi:hypothetical protein
MNENIERKEQIKMANDRNLKVNLSVTADIKEAQ